MQLRKKKFIFRLWSFISEQSSSKINVFPVSHTIFFLPGGQKVDLFAPQGAIKSTLWPASRKNTFQIFQTTVINKITQLWKKVKNVKLLQISSSTKLFPQVFSKDRKCGSYRQKTNSPLKTTLIQGVGGWTFWIQTSFLHQNWMPNSWWKW